jgi:branched-chain amino acid transport system permease protein
VRLEDLREYVLNGLSLGAIYAFIALGYTMVYGIIRLINFAHGEFFMFGGYVGYFVLRDSGIDRLPLPAPLPAIAQYLAALTAASLAAGLLAVAVERVAYRPVRRAGRIAALLTAVCVSLILQNLAVKAWEPTPRPYPDPRVWFDVAELPDRAPHNLWAEERFRTTDGEVSIREERVFAAGEPIDAEARERLRAAGRDRLFRKATLEPRWTNAFVLLALVLWTPVLWFLVKRTRTGKAMRAVSEDMDAARLMGIPIDRIVARTFFLGAFVAGVGGVAFCVTYGKVDPLTGFLPGLKAFIAAVIGGIGSIPGAILGGVFLGVVESVLPYVFREGLGWTQAFAWKDAIAFSLLVLVLVVRPTGLLGKPFREKV